MDDNYFGIDVSKFFNSSQNSTIKLEYLKSIFKYLTDSVLINHIKLPDISIIQNSLDSIDSTFYKFHNTLTYSDDSNIQKGFRQLLIKEKTINFDFDVHITDINLEIIATYSNIYNIYLNCKQDLNLYRSLSFINNNKTSDYINYIFQYNLALNPFYFIYNCKESIQSYNVAVFPFIYHYAFLLKIYENYSDVKSKVSSIIFKPNNIYTKEKIKLYFKDYITNNKVSIINKILDYFNGNVFLFSDNITSKFKTGITSLLTPILNQLSDIFNTCPEINNILNDITTTIVYDSILQVNSHSVHENIYSTHEDFFNYSYDYKSDEISNIKEQIKKLLNENLELLNNLELLPYKFKDSPLFFLNSHYILTLKILNILENNTTNLFNTQDYLSKITPNLAVIKEFVKTNKFNYNPDIIKHSILMHFKRLINIFINSESFTNWLLIKFYPILINSNSIYSINSNYDCNKIIDILKLLFNIIFIDDLISNILFKTYTDNISIDFENVIKISSFNTTLIDDSFISSINSLFIDNEYLQNLVSNFFRASAVSKYLESLLYPYSIQKYLDDLT
jgi:hypothetical protein